MIRTAKRWVFLAALLPALASLGCRSIWSDQATLPAAHGEPQRTRIVYRTRTDRLNVAGGELPACSIAAMQIVVPHPEGKTSCAQVTVAATPCTPDASPFPSRGVTGAISSFAGGEASSASAAPPFVRSVDIPLWQVDAVVGSLDKAKFFDRRRTVLSPEVFLSVEREPHAVGKRYSPVAELDAILLRAVAAETVSTPSPPPADAGPIAAIPSRPALVRLPPLEPVDRP